MKSTLCPNAFFLISARQYQFLLLFVLSTLFLLPLCLSVYLSVSLHIYIYIYSICACVCMHVWMCVYQELTGCRLYSESHNSAKDVCVNSVPPNPFYTQYFFSSQLQHRVSGLSRCTFTSPTFILVFLLFPEVMSAYVYSFYCHSLFVWLSFLHIKTNFFSKCFPKCEWIILGNRRLNGISTYLNKNAVQIFQD